MARRTQAPNAAKRSRIISTNSPKSCSKQLCKNQQTHPINHTGRLLPTRVFFIILPPSEIHTLPIALVYFCLPACVLCLFLKFTPPTTRVGFCIPVSDWASPLFYHPSNSTGRHLPTRVCFMPFLKFTPTTARVGFCIPMSFFLHFNPSLCYPSNRTSRLLPTHVFLCFPLMYAAPPNRTGR